MDVYDVSFKKELYSLAKEQIESELAKHMDKNAKFGHSHFDHNIYHRHLATKNLGSVLLSTRMTSTTLNTFNRLF